MCALCVISCPSATPHPPTPRYLLFEVPSIAGSLGWRAAERSEQLSSRDSGAHERMRRVAGTVDGGVCTADLGGEVVKDAALAGEGGEGGGDGRRRDCMDW